MRSRPTNLKSAILILLLKGHENIHSLSRQTGELLRRKVPLAAFEVVIIRLRDEGLISFRTRTSAVSGKKVGGEGGVVHLTAKGIAIAEVLKIMELIPSCRIPEANLIFSRLERLISLVSLGDGRGMEQPTRMERSQSRK